MQPQFAGGGYSVTLCVLETPVCLKRKSGGDRN